jgi:hypothetical protein
MVIINWLLPNCPWLCFKPIGYWPLVIGYGYLVLVVGYWLFNILGFDLQGFKGLVALDI